VIQLKLYPLKFKTIFKDKIWGGQKIRTVLGKDFGNLPNCGETWEISGVEGNISEVAEGHLEGMNLKELIQKFEAALVGEKIHKKFGDEFPLLVKFIDANDDLSIQVHPNDELAKARHNGHGKTEMWYIFQADHGAELITGFNRKMSKEKFLDYFERGRIMDVLNHEKVFNDDVFYLPAGRVHTIGKGLLLAEIQQTSDTTYRIYDFDRVDDKGNKRELHVEESLDAIDYTYHEHYKTMYQNKLNEPVKLVKSPYFTTNKLECTKDIERDYHYLDSFIIYVCMSGELNIAYDGGSIEVKMGDCVLLPAELKKVTLETTSGFKMLESYIS
jgi:mannose-6-phosphate isomerase